MDFPTIKCSLRSIHEYIRFRLKTIEKTPPSDSLTVLAYSKPSEHLRNRQDEFQWRFELKIIYIYYIVLYFFNVDFLWQDFEARVMVLAGFSEICHIFENETPNFRGR